jgi:hypothetical protein
MAMFDNRCRDEHGRLDADPNEALGLHQGNVNYEKSWPRVARDAKQMSLSGWRAPNKRFRS